MPSIGSNTLLGTRLLESLLTPARTGNLDRLVRTAGKHAASLGLPRERVSEVELAVEEVVANVCMYAYEEGEGDLAVSFFIGSGPAKLVVEIVDSGIPFNILTAPEPDLASNLDQRKVGGLGAFLVRKIADEAEYERAEGKNIVRLAFNAADD
jgi:serine/threonine-protein kinase RsbW